jgi:hypothetical protein
LYRGINNFKKGYQARTNIEKDEKGDLVADSHSTLNMCMNNCSQLLNVLGVSDVRQTETHPAWPPVSEHSAFEVEMATKKRKVHKSPGTHLIPAELLKAGGRTILSVIHIL